MLINWERSISSACFLWIFPFFFFYHSFVALGIIPPVLGNWWTVSHVLALVALSPLLLLDARHIDVRPHLPILALGAYCGAVGLYHFAFGEPYATGTGPLVSTAKLLISWVALYLLGFYLTKSDRLGNVLVACCLAMAAITPVLVYAEALELYQFMAQAVVFTALYPIAILWNQRKAAIAGGVALAAVVYIGSRSELLGLTAVLVGWSALCAMHGKWRLVLQMVAAGAVSGLLITAAIYSFTAVPAMLAGPAPVVEAPAGGAQAPTTEAPTPAAPHQSPIDRQMELTDLSSSRSMAQRTELFWSGLDAIKGSPITGDYAGQIREYGGSGYYIHNALSVWRQFGIVPFILFVGISAVGGWLCFRKLFIERVEAPMWVLAGMMAGYTILLVVVSKSVFWPLPALAWGLVAARYRKPL